MTKSPPVECPFCKRFLILDSKGLQPKHGSWTGRGNCPGSLLTPSEAQTVKETPKSVAKDPGFSI